MQSEQRSRRSKGLGAALGIAMIVLACVGIVLVLADDDVAGASTASRDTVRLGPDVRAAAALEAGPSEQPASGRLAPSAARRGPGEEAAESHAVGAGGAAREDSPDPPAPVVLRGRVEDPWGEPLAGARVTTRTMRRDGRRIEVESDALGRFELTVAAARGAVLVAEADGLAASAAEWVQLEPGATLELVLALREATGLRGRVTTQADQPAVGAKVVVSQGGQRWSGAEPASAVTDAEGRFEVLGLAEGLYQVSAALDGHVREVRDDVPVSLEHGGELELALAAAGRVEGSLRLPDGAPMAGALVFPQLDGREDRSERSDADGRFVLNGLPAGPLEVFVRSEDYGHTARARVQVAPGRASSLELVVRPGPRLVGVLRDTQGEPLPGVVVRARGAEGGVRREGRSDDAGHYVVENLYPGSYTVSVSSGRRRAALIEETVEVGEADAQLDLVVPAASGLSGLVVDAAGVPVAAAGVYAIVDGDYRGQAETDREGRFVFDELPADTYRIFARVGDDRLVGQVERVELHAGQPQQDLRVLVRAPATLHARLLDAGGQPLVGVVVDVVALDAPVRRRQRTDLAGQAALAPLYRGDYSVSVSQAGLALAARKLGVKGLAVEPATVRIDGADLTLDLVAAVVEE